MVHDSIWRSCEAAAERLRQRREQQYGTASGCYGAELGAKEEPNLEDLTDDAVEIAVALGVKKAVAERLVLDAWRENPNGDSTDWAAWICRNQNKR